MTKLLNIYQHYKNLLAIFYLEMRGIVVDPTEVINAQAAKIRANIDGCIHYRQLENCNDWITSALHIPYGDAAFIQIMQLKEALVRRDSFLRLQDSVLENSTEFADTAINLAFINQPVNED